MNKQLGEIVNCIERERVQLFESVNDLSPQQINFRPATDAWTIAENLDHLHLSEREIVKLIKLSVMKAAKLDAPVRGENASEDEWLTSLDRFRIETVTRKLKALERTTPRAGLTKDEVLESLRSSRAELIEAARAAASFDLARISYPHPFLGDFNLYQWVRFIGKHDLRHLNQIEAIKQAANFPARAAAH